MAKRGPAQSSRPWRAALYAPRRFLAYSRDERAILIAAALDLFRIHRSLKRRGYAITFAWTAARRHRLAKRVARVSVDEAARIVDAAARWTIGLETSCLRRAILLNWLLHSAGARSELVSGIGRKNKRWVGHAWVEVDGRRVGSAAQEADAFVEFRDQLSRRHSGSGTPKANSPIEPSRR